MKNIFALLASCFILMGQSSAQIVSLENPPDMSNGSYLIQQHINFDGLELTWGSGTTGGPSFVVQAYEEFGTIDLVFGEWNGAPFEVTPDPLALNASVETAPSWTGQRYISGPPITNAYFGIRYLAGGGDFNYGWINLTTIENFDAGMINAVAFNTTVNEDIFAGQTVIPELSSVAYLLLALAGVASPVFLRRKRRT